MDKKSQTQPEHTNAKGIALLLGVSYRTLEKYRADGMPFERGCYDVAACVAWFVDFRIGLYRANYIDRKITENDPEISQQQRLTKAKAEKVERENKEAENMLVSIEKFRTILGYMSTINTNSLESMGARLCNQLAGIDDPAEIQELLIEENRDVRQTLVQKIKEYDLEVLNYG